LVQKRARNSLEAIATAQDLLNRIPASQQLRESMDKWDYMKLKPSAQQKKWSLN
jgi:hypothetical protein